MARFTNVSDLGNTYFLCKKSIQSKYYLLFNFIATYYYFFLIQFILLFLQSNNLSVFLWCHHIRLPFCVFTEITDTAFAAPNLKSSGEYTLFYCKIPTVKNIRNYEISCGHHTISACLSISNLSYSRPKSELQHCREESLMTSKQTYCLFKFFFAQ